MKKHTQEQVYCAHFYNARTWKHTWDNTDANVNTKIATELNKSVNSITKILEWLLEDEAKQNQNSQQQFHPWLHNLMIHYDERTLLKKALWYNLGFKFRNWPEKLVEGTKAAMSHANEVGKKKYWSNA
jgi:hypothetical protein